jgi:hypothetical protein
MLPKTCKIVGLAVDTWAEFDCEQSIEEVVQALIDLPASEAVDQRIARLPVIFTQRTGRVFGRQFSMIGWCPSPGDWRRIDEVHPTSAKD